MNFAFTEEQELFRKTVRDFMERECPREYIRRLDEEKQYPYELYRKWAQQGWLGLPFPEEYGGGNASAIDMMILAENIAVRGYDIGTVYSTPVFTTLNIVRLGTQQQKDYYIPKFIEGGVRFAVGFTEPEAGSDAANIQTTAIQDDDGFVINGEKMFCTMGHIEDTVIQLAVRTDPQAPKHKGISLFLVDNNTPGIEIQRLSTMGRNISGTTRVLLRDVRVPKERLLGPLHEGWQALLSHHGTSRLFLSTLYVGAAQTVVDDAIEYANQRVQFDQPIAKFQAIAHMLVDMQTEVEAARLLVYRAADMIDRHIKCLKEVCMAKLYASEVFLRVASNGMQVMGGYGYMMEYDMQRHLRDARIVTVAGGSSQIQRNVIARQMGII